MWRSFLVACQAPINFCSRQHTTTSHSFHASYYMQREAWECSKMWRHQLYAQIWCISYAPYKIGFDKVIFFWIPHAPPTPLSPTTHFTHSFTLFGHLALLLYPLFLFLFLSTQHKHFSHTLLSSPTNKITGKSLRTFKHLHIFNLR